MVPHKTPRGAAALERLRCFEGVPPPFDKVKRLVVPDALQVLRLQHGHRFCRLGALAQSVSSHTALAGRAVHMLHVCTYRASTTLFLFLCCCCCSCCLNILFLAVRTVCVGRPQRGSDDAHTALVYPAPPPPSPPPSLPPFTL